MDDEQKKKERSSLGRDLDSIMGGMSLSELDIINGRTLIDGIDDGELDIERTGISSSIDELEVEIDWTKEEKVPIHELNIKPVVKKKGKKK